MIRKIWMLFAIIAFLKIDCCICEIITVVDLKEVASASKAGKEIEKQIQKANDDSKKDILDLESKIKAMEADKKSDYDSRKIEDMQLILYDMVREKKYQISEAYRIAMSALDKAIVSAVKTVCDRKKASIAIDSSTMVYRGNGSQDITAEVIEAVNLSCPSIKVELKEVK